MNDPRRTRRLVKTTELMATVIGRGLSGACAGNAAALAGGYRLMANEAITPLAIQSGPFAAVAQRASEISRLLAVEDTTSLVYRHAVRDELGDVGSNVHSRARGVHAHSVLLVDATSEHTLLIRHEYI